MPTVDTALLHAVAVLGEDEQIRQGAGARSDVYYHTDTEAVPVGCYCVVTVQVRRLDGQAVAGVEQVGA